MPSASKKGAFLSLREMTKMTVNLRLYPEINVGNIAYLVTVYCPLRILGMRLFRKYHDVQWGGVAWGDSVNQNAFKELLRRLPVCTSFGNS